MNIRFGTSTWCFDAYVPREWMGRRIKLFLLFLFLSPLLSLFLPPSLPASLPAGLLCSEILLVALRIYGFGTMHASVSLFKSLAGFSSSVHIQIRNRPDRATPVVLKPGLAMPVVGFCVTARSLYVMVRWSRGGSCVETGGGEPETGLVRMP